MSTAKANKHIEIVRSGTASLKWQKACEKIRQVLEHRYLRVGVTVIDHIDNLESLVIEQPDLVFLRMKNASPMALFGDRRTYQYQGKAIGGSVHLGVDLASTAHAPISMPSRNRCGSVSR